MVVHEVVPGLMLSGLPKELGYTQAPLPPAPLLGSHAVWAAPVSHHGWAGRAVCSQPLFLLRFSSLLSPSSALKVMFTLWEPPTFAVKAWKPFSVQTLGDPAEGPSSLEATGHQQCAQPKVPPRQALGSWHWGQPSSTANGLMSDMAAFCREAQTDCGEPDFKIQQMITLCKG